jgi:hypothetical protein
MEQRSRINLFEPFINWTLPSIETLKPTAKLSIKQIRDIDEIASACRVALKKTVENSSLAFQIQTLARGKQAFLLTGAGSSQATVGNRNYPVLFLAVVNGELFWFALVIVFGFANRIQFLESVSMVVVKGLANDSKVPILRAEWDCTDEHLNQIHGQPHWHVYPSAILNSNLETDTILDILTDPGTDTDSAPGTASLPYFHFAMATRWHEGQTSAHATLEYVDGLTEWISGCILYTREQLLYAWTTI